MQPLRRGDLGSEVAEIRELLTSQELLVPANNGCVDHTGTAATDLPDGYGSAAQRFDLAVEHAVRAFQQRRGLTIDGIVGPATYQALRDARLALGDRSLAYSISQPMRGDDVSALQERLLELGYDAGRADGLFGWQTEHGLRSFQRDYGLATDGVCGPATLRALRQLGPKVRGGRPVYLRERERVRRSGPALAGKRIVLDPGHGGDDPGVVVGGVAEADLMWDLAQRLEGRMAATEMEVLLTRGKRTSPTGAERAGLANDADADLLLSLHTDADSSPLAQGIATFHFGTGHGATSTVGEALAALLQRELVSRTRMLDCRTHPKTWEVLRMTRMPAVSIDTGYLTNHTDRERLLDPAFRDLLVDGILVAVKRLYLLGENDAPTGTFTIDDVLRQEPKLVR